MRTTNLALLTATTYATSTTKPARKRGTDLRYVQIAISHFAAPVIANMYGDLYSGELDQVAVTLTDSAAAENGRFN